MRKPFCLFLAATLAVLSISCTKNNPDRQTVKLAAYCKARITDEDPESSKMELYLLPEENNLEDIYADEVDEPVPNCKHVSGDNWFRITLLTKDSTEDIFNQSYTLINSNKTNPESLRQGYAEVYWQTRGGAFASGGTLTVATNSITLKAQFPVKGWVEVTFEGEILKFDHIY